MYNLENNVAWTSDLKDAFKRNVTRCKIVHGLNEYNESNFLKDAELQDVRYVPDAGFIGQAVARMLTVTLINDESSNINLENQEFEFKIGADYNNSTYYINYGNFLVNEAPENDDTNGTIKVIAYDYMIKFNQDYVDRIEYPCTLYELLEDICDQAGVELGSESFANDDFQVINNQFSGKTLREVLQHIAKSAFSWARIGQDNKLYLDFEVNNTIDETIDVDDYKMDSFKKANEYYGAINKVTFADSDITGHEESVQDNADIALHGIKELIIYDNYFAYTTVKRQELIQAGTRLFGLKYMPIQQMDMIGLAYLDSNDILGIKDSESTIFTTRNLSHIIKYNGILSDSITAEASSKTEETYTNTNSPISANIKVERSVDRAKGEIEQMVSSTIIVYDEIEGMGLLVTQEAKALPTWKVKLTGNKTYDSGATVIEKTYTLVIMPERYPYLKTQSDELLLTQAGENIIYSTKKYSITCNELLRKENTSDTIDIDENRDIIYTRRIGIEDGETYILPQPIISNLGSLTIDLYSGKNYIYLDNDEETKLYIKYILKNDYTDNYVSSVEIISKINQSPEEISIEASKLRLEGYTTINGGFSVDLEGNASIANKTVEIDKEGIHLADGAKIAGGDGVLTNLVFNSQTSGGSYSNKGYYGYRLLGFESTYDSDAQSGMKFVPTAIEIDVNIPENFVIESAYLVLYTVPLYWGGLNYYGYPRNLGIYSSSASMPEITYENWASEYYTEQNYSGELIQNAWSSGSTIYTPSNVGSFNLNVIKSVDLKEHLSTGSQLLYIQSGDGVPSYDTTAGQTTASQKTGLGKAVLNVIGYTQYEF